MKEGCEQAGDNGFVLPIQSNYFLKECKNKVTDRNLYLDQNRFCKVNFKERYSYSTLLKELVKEKSMNVFAQNSTALHLANYLNKRNETLAGNFPHCLNYRFEPDDKLILGEGGSAYINVQPLRLHPLYGIPFMPASVLKGSLRNVWIMEQFSGAESEAEKDGDFIRLFGGKQKDSARVEGMLRFFDCFPDQCEIGIDIQTVHYKDYYNTRGKVNPTDDQSTLPISFMCLRESVFSIFIAFCDTEEQLWLRKHAEIESMINCMFTMYGIGAKTTLGYGVGVCTAGTPGHPNYGKEF